MQPGPTANKQNFQEKAGSEPSTGNLAEPLLRVFRGPRPMQGIPPSRLTESDTGKHRASALSYAWWVEGMRLLPLAFSLGRKGWILLKKKLLIRKGD